MNGITRALNPGLELPGIRGPSALLDEHERATRTNASNDGRGFQDEILTTCGEYQRRRIATLKKIDPPVRIIWPWDPKQGKKVQRVIFMRNPFLDFGGCWNAKNARALFVECKSGATHRLPFLRSGGLTEEQFASACIWRSAGAAVCVLFRWAGKVCLFTPEALVEAKKRGDKSLTFESGIPVPRGESAVIWDFLPILAGAIWPEERKSLPPASSTATVVSNPEFAGESNESNEV